MELEDIIGTERIINKKGYRFQVDIMQEEKNQAFEYWVNVLGIYDTIVKTFDDLQDVFDFINNFTLEKQKKLQKLSEEKLKSIKLKYLYGYRTDWYDRYQKNLSESAFKEFLKAKKLIKTIEKWEDESDENFMKLRGGTHTYNDFLEISK